MKKILFFPGTFNPPHLGHASVLHTALNKFSFDEVWILPSGKRVDREISTSEEDRRNLSTLFVSYIQSQTTVPVRLITDALDGVEGKYTHEIIVDLKSNPEYEVYQLCGTDGFTSIKERVIGQNEKFIISKRAGYEIPANILENSNLYFIDEEKDFQGISSTKIREMIKNGDDQYKKLLPNLITDYIEDKGLYKTKVS
jgi:nicotinate-nucleotide adenylyltransferase